MIKNGTTRLIGFNILLICLFTSCSQAPSKESLDAIAALQKIQAGTQVGINYQNYGQLLIEAKAKTNEAVRLLPDGQLKDEFNGAMDAYADAAKAWGVKIEGHQLHDNYEPGKSLIQKYQLPMSEPKYGSRDVDPGTALQLIWLRADLHLQEVAKLLKVDKKP